MGKLFKLYLNASNIYRCENCSTHFTHQSDLESTAFRSGSVRAYLFKTCINVTFGPIEERILTTGLHTICDLYCLDCESKIGWTYIEAADPEQKYKEGKFI